MANVLDSLLQYIATALGHPFVRQNIYNSSTSFSAAVQSADIYQSTYIGTVLDNVKSNIASMSTGVHNVSSGVGPNYGVVLHKLNSDNFDGIVLQYGQLANYFIRFSYTGSTYYVQIFRPSTVAAGGGTA